MIHVVEIDDTTRNGKRLLSDIRHKHKGVTFRSPVVNGVPPEGYVTSDEAYKIGLESLNRICRKYGILE